MSPNDADGMANSVDPDQTAPFAQAYLSENLRSLRYYSLRIKQCITYILLQEQDVRLRMSKKLYVFMKFNRMSDRQKIHLSP